MAVIVVLPAPTIETVPLVEIVATDVLLEVNVIAAELVDVGVETAKDESPKVRVLIAKVPKRGVAFFTLNVTV